MGIDVAITLLLGLIDRATTIGTLIQKAQSEKRDLTAAEIDQLAALDDVARKALDEAIAKARAGNV